jgi:hypothetical protein
VPRPLERSSLNDIGTSGAVVIPRSKAIASTCLGTVPLSSCLHCTVDQARVSGSRLLMPKP